jgi:hypothetical protein
MNTHTIGYFENFPTINETASKYHTFPTQSQPEKTKIRDEAIDIEKLINKTHHSNSNRF